MLFNPRLDGAPLLDDLSQARGVRGEVDILDRLLLRHFIGAADESHGGAHGERAPTGDPVHGLDGSGMRRGVLPG